MASLLLYVVVLCSCYSISIAYGGDEMSYVVVPDSSFEPQVTCSTSRAKPEANGATVYAPLVHRHGPCSPSPFSYKPSLTEKLRGDRARAKQMTSNVSIPTYLGNVVHSLEYVVTVGLGTPAVSQVLLIDTGSDLPWVQCEPCNSTLCYPQKDPLFDPSRSSTYVPIPCHSHTCRKLGDDFFAQGCPDGHCGYFTGYGDGSNTRGVYSNETLTLVPGVTVKDFRFGCGHSQRDPSHDRFDGVLGLGRRPESIVSQTAHVYGGAFSYCLPAVDNEPGFLELGAPTNMSGFVLTPMGNVPKEDAYVVKLTGISVGGKMLDVPPSAYSSGMVIDNGQIVTRLQETAYGALQSAFRKAMAAYPLLPHHSNDLDTCYNLTGYRNVTVPRVALTFSGGGTIELDVPNGMLLNGCLAFEESGPDIGLGTIGNVNQRTMQVLYDAGQKRVGFRTGAC